VTAGDAMHVDRAVRVLRAGGVIAYASEGVWGLGCDPFNADAVLRILDLKSRDVAMGLILVAASVEQLAPLLVHVPRHARAELQQSWPGPVTWVVPIRGELPRWITGRHASVALRVSGHTQLRALCKAYGKPIVSTSANPHGRPPARTALAVRRYFRNHIDYILPGATGSLGRPSQIRDALSGRVLRV
jgi:L-threonylcarbamoyladenylate synthase